MKDLTPEEQLDSFISKYAPQIATQARVVLAKMRALLPGAIELVYDNYNALAIGFSSTERTSDVIVSLAVYARGVNLYFMYGARLPDPHNVLRGSGNQGRFIPLENIGVLDAPAVKALLRAAVTHATTPLPSGGRGRTVIRSISAKQRPRRPPPNKRLKLPGARN